MFRDMVSTSFLPVLMTTKTEERFPKATAAWLNDKTGRGRSYVYPVLAVESGHSRPDNPLAHEPSEVFLSICSLYHPSDFAT